MRNNLKDVLLKLTIYELAYKKKDYCKELFHSS